MNCDLYETFAERYDLTGGKLDKTDSGEAAFFQKLIAQHNIHDVLDCACGTGWHLLLLHDLGCEVWGSDVSKAMLGQARKNLDHFGCQVPLCQADYRDLPSHFEKKFDAVVCLSAIGYMANKAQFLRAFSSMKAVLRQGGILILTTVPTDRQWREKPRFSLVENTSDVTRLFVIDYFRKSVHYNVLDIFHSAQVSALEVWSAELTVLLADEQERLLKKAGFKGVDFYGAFDFSLYDEKRSNYLITVATN